MTRIFVPLFVALAACSASRPSSAPSVAPTATLVLAPQPPAAPGAPSPRADGRLPDIARPVAYTLDLDVDPSQPGFHGRVQIAIDVLHATRAIVLHARDMTLVHATITPDGFTTPFAAQYALRAPGNGRREADELVLTTDANVPVGHATIDLEFQRAFETSLLGLYRAQSGGAWYAFTQFESDFARRAFPCFDEPGFKTPWDLSLTVPSQLVAAANMPETSRDVHGDHTTVHFARTPPMQSYLVAIAVGPFDVVQGATTPVPIRVLTAHGRGTLARDALAAGDEYLRAFGAYFDVPYPYPKLDLVAVPEFAAGAMENAGLITYREERLLVDPARPSINVQRQVAIVTAHEVAHQWFGDYVTMAWWNDVWLNEAFASWGEAREVDAVHPGFGARLEMVRDRAAAMETDALPTTRPIRRANAGLHDSEGREAVTITYFKGAAVLRMLEAWLTDDTFRDGLREYMRAHAWGTANADDLFAALSHAVGHDVAPVAASFIDQAGVPIVSAELDCANPHAPTVTLTQHEFTMPALADAASSEPRAPRVWQIPACVAYDTDHGRGRTCALVGAAPTTVALEAATRCPHWLYPNADETGYYRSAFTPPVRALFARGAHADLTPAERVGLADNAWALLRAGQIGVADYARVVELVSRAHERIVIETVLDELVTLRDRVASDATAPRVSAWIASLLRPIAREAPGQSDERVLLRRDVILALGGPGDDATTRAFAEHAMALYLGDPHSTAPELAAAIVPVASRRANASRVGELLTALAHVDSPADRLALNAGLANLQDPAALQTALDATLTPAVRAQDVARIVFDAASDRARRPIVAAWVHEHLDALRARLTNDGSVGFAAMVGTMCSESEVAAEDAFWSTHASELEGADRTVMVARLRALQCAAFRARVDHDLAVRR